ncbi:MAG: hypothetical protein CVV39_00330 [Planctomycetes bacterium HGW-Planctomycetes-1]|nr:MAG: hypothetical protein CVV39_00330 [Planctomycetes bacterium HGW-Planctomycetes-1]
MEWNRLFKSVIITVILLSSIVTAAEEKRPAALGSPEPAPTAEVNEAQFPYIGEITGADLNVRSGPGTNYYSCGRISAPARVVVVGQTFSWSQILPPPGSFSWIYKQYVDTDINNPDVGIVNGNSVRVYAGADDRDAMVSDSVQIGLDKGQKVRILGAAVGDYYKISPPEGATLWTSSQYIKFIRKADEIDITVPKSPADARPEVLMEQLGGEGGKIELYYDLAKQVEDEKTKPPAEQNFSKIRAELNALVADANSGKAGEYAKYLLKDVERCELAKDSAELLESQKAELQNKLTEIEEGHKETVENLPQASKYAVVGIFKQSVVYEDRPTGNKRFLIVDANDIPLCYAEAIGEAANIDFEDYFGSKVGLVGEISSDPLSSSALVKFTEIERLEEAAEKK